MIWLTLTLPFIFTFLAGGLFLPPCTSQGRIFYMKSLEDIKALLSQYKPIIQEKYKVSELGIFGSYVRGQ
jgi:hypothetical protein